LGVQWHPEWDCQSTPFYQAIFQAFAQAMQLRQRDRLR
jgi:putative glutamine amidotransferase